MAERIFRLIRSRSAAPFRRAGLGGTNQPAAASIAVAEHSGALGVVGSVRHWEDSSPASHGIPRQEERYSYLPVYTKATDIQEKTGF